MEIPIFTDFVYRSNLRSANLTGEVGRSRAATVVVLPAARCAVHVTYQRIRPILERP